MAEELGLTVEELPSVGCSGTTIRPETAAAYQETLAQLEQAIMLWRGEEAAPELSPRAGPRRYWRSVWKQS